MANETVLQYFRSCHILYTIENTHQLEKLIKSSKELASGREHLEMSFKGPIINGEECKKVSDAQRNSVWQFGRMTLEKCNQDVRKSLSRRSRPG